MNKKNFKNELSLVIKRIKDFPDNSMFNFIVDERLRKALVKSHNEAIFVKKIIKEFSINYSDAHPLNEIVVLHFASIYESILDFVLDKYFKIEIANLLEVKKYAKVDISDGLVFKNKTYTLFLCKEKKETKKLKHIKFELKVSKAKELNLITDNIERKIVRLYNFRNNVHILKAVTDKDTTKPKQKTVTFTKNSMAEYCGDELLRDFCINIKNKIQTIV